MYYKIPNGTVERVDNNAGFIAKCWLPPLGYGVNKINGKVDRTDIIKCSHTAKQQKWVRTELPKDWSKKRADEIRKQSNDPDYYDPELEFFREQEDRRRIYGVWVYINGNPYYLTGNHYMYLNWWFVKKQYPDFRDCDRKRYYFDLYCQLDPNCLGMCEASNRRSGKSFRSMLFLYERVSIMPNSNGGIQSKTDPDVNNLYAEKLKTPFLRLPDFLRPEIDEMSGVNNGMSFTKTRKRGKGAMDNAGDLGLNSEISFRSSVEGSYDGYELYAYVADEVAKPSKADTYERHKIVRYCLRVGTNFVGKALYTTTTEEIKGISMDNSPFKKLWDESDPNERDANGLTKSWLYRYLMPAQETLAFDEYGFPTIKENITFIKNSREVFKGKMKDYLDEIKKNPMNVEEMFMATLDNECHFDDELIVEQVEMLKYTNPTIRGNLIWENGLQDSNVIFVEDKKGNWEIVKEVLKFVEGKKMVERRGSMSYPLNVMTFTIGTDPFDHDITVDARNSKGAFLVEAKDTPLLPDPIRETEVCMYLFRPKSSTIFYEDVLKTCVFFGCDMLFENQKINIKKHFINRGYEAFLVKLKGREEYGVPSSETTKMAALEMAVNRIKFNVHKMYFIKLLEQSLVFDIRYTEKYDAVMAWFYTLISNDNRIVKNKATEKTREVEDVIPRWLLDD